MKNMRVRTELKKKKTKNGRANARTQVTPNTIQPPLGLKKKKNKTHTQMQFTL